jgi:hypothetical protein
MAGVFATATPELRFHSIVGKAFSFLLREPFSNFEDLRKQAKSETGPRMFASVEQLAIVCCLRAK